MQVVPTRDRDATLLFIHSWNLPSPCTHPTMTVPPPPLAQISVAQVLAAGLAVALASALVAITNSIRRKMRAAKLLAPVPGPQGVFLLGFVPEMVKNIDRLYEFMVRWWCALLMAKHTRALYLYLPYKLLPL